MCSWSTSAFYTEQYGFISRRLGEHPEQPDWIPGQQRCAARDMSPGKPRAKPCRSYITVRCCWPSSLSGSATPCSSDLHRVHMCSHVFGDLGGSKQGRHDSLPICRRSSVKLTTQYTDHIGTESLQATEKAGVKCALWPLHTLSNKPLSWGYLGIIYLRFYIKYSQLSIINASPNRGPGNN